MKHLTRKALAKMVASLIRDGFLRVVMPDGDIQEFGDLVGEPITVRLHDNAIIGRLALHPELALGEAYTNGSLTIDGDDLHGFLALVIRNTRKAAGHRIWWQRPVLKSRAVLRWMAQNNFIERARGNVAHHYDLSGDLYDLFLDGDRQYSCGYFKDPDASLDQAQADKKEHVARKLMIEPGMKVLDIGCGWGGMALTLARDYGARVTGITLSQEQHAYAKQRVEREGLSDRVDLKICDYREVDGTYDRIVSVGMFEHVGLRHYDDYFQAVRDRLPPDGIALIHTIGWAAPPEGTNPWIGKYIFPGGYIPTVSEAMNSVERARLWATDVECWRLHYAYTLRHWYDRFSAHEDEVAAMYDHRFVRMWRFYLVACEQTFRHGPQAVYQFQISRSVDAVPLTRDYIYDRSGRRSMPRASACKRPALVAGDNASSLSSTAVKANHIPPEEQGNDQQNPTGH